MSERIVSPEEAQAWLASGDGTATDLLHTVATEPNRRDMAYDAGVDDGYAQAVDDYADRTRAAVVKALRWSADRDGRKVYDRADAIENGAPL